MSVPNLQMRNLSWEKISTLNMATQVVRGTARTEAQLC
jgi:hypothetical protein